MSRRLRRAPAAPPGWLPVRPPCRARPSARRARGRLCWPTRQRHGTAPAQPALRRRPRLPALHVASWPRRRLQWRPRPAQSRPASTRACAATRAAPMVRWRPGAACCRSRGPGPTTPRTRLESRPTTSTTARWSWRCKAGRRGPWRSSMRSASARWSRGSGPCPQREPTRSRLAAAARPRCRAAWLWACARVSSAAGDAREPVGDRCRPVLR